MGCTAEQGGDCGNDEKRAQQVSVNDFYIGKYPVTQAQWKAVMGDYPPELYNTACDDCPVERVNWDDVQEFIRKLNEYTGRSYRVPTEAEWEYAARGGKQSKGFKYSGSDNIDEVAWYDGNYKNSKHGAHGTTHPVGSKEPNELGIYDMSGNVWESCTEWHSAYSSAAQTNSVGAPNGLYRVLRGGSWSSTASRCIVSYRNDFTNVSRYNYGFRVVRSF
jgi:formylglycine-generating enzyme required for sulfatase activity